MKPWVWVFVPLALAGCTEVKQITAPDGRVVQSISCDGALLSEADCVAKAKEICPAGYDVVSTSRYDQSVLNMYPGPLLVATVDHRILNVQCH